MALVFAVMRLYNIFKFLLFLSILFYTLLKSGIDKSTEWATIPACPSLTWVFNGGNTEGTNSSKILCLILAYFLFYVGLCQD